ncbi:hypothetical protein EK21DRAFT_87943 [Setomelanomma holmii]|uniref:feruloyl esterase n=1 Tax=Setomelanomma holmii TaxID=210430 RepID=A0A9P4HE70_9PLEO|nr:hypothetical protein EK21DRAFT_87943 [Setomelanomma holmii]
MLFGGNISTTALIALRTLQSINAVPVASNGCGKSSPAELIPGDAPANFTLYSRVGAGERRYLLHLLSTYTNDCPAPLIIALHAFGQTAGSMEEVTRFSDSDSNQDYITVYPEGINNLWLGDRGAPNSSVVDDRAFINDLLDSLESTLYVDTLRIYTTGFSNGGAFSDVSAACYAKNSLGYSLFEAEPCMTDQRTRPLPSLDIHGDSDGVIAYNGNNSRFDIDDNGIPDPDTLPIPRWLSDWAIRNGCASAANYTMQNYPAEGDEANATSWLQNETIQQKSWTCDGWANVVIGYYVKDLGHGWPSTIALEGILEDYRGGPTTWNASTFLMGRLARWSLPAAAAL